jgi:chemotaxis protein methyltransferase CheR
MLLECADGLELTDRDLAAVVRLVYERSGITLHEGKRALIIARLQKRVRLGGFRSFGQYLRHVEADASGDELTALLDAIATNHTSFFREPQHFEYLAGVLPGLVGADRRRPIRGWSAACSTGEEPYSIVMSVIDRLGPDAGARLRLLASDLSTKALATARAGVYKAERVADLPMSVLRAHFDKGMGRQDGLARVTSRVREAVEFRQLNLLRLPAFGPTLDFIFCRNVMIYFDANVQQRVVAALEQALAPGGYLFISHSESLNGVSHGLKWSAPAVYRRVTA